MLLTFKKICSLTTKLFTNWTKSYKKLFNSYSIEILLPYKGQNISNPCLGYKAVTVI